MPWSKGGNLLPHVQPRMANLATCSANTQCLSARCHGNVCRASTGQSCSITAECLNSICEGGVCKVCAEGHQLPNMLPG